MPMFEYKCNDCGHEFEELVFGEKKPACPKCKSENTEKKISAFSTSGSTGSSASAAKSCNNFT